MYNLQIDNLPKHCNDMAIVSGLKQLIDPITTQMNFKKIIFKRTRYGRALLFIKFAKQNHMKQVYSMLCNKSIWQHTISVQIIGDDDIPQSTELLSCNSWSTVHRSGFTVEYLQNGSERIITIIPNTKDTSHHSLSQNTKRSIIIKKQKQKHIAMDHHKSETNSNNLVKRRDASMMDSNMNDIERIQSDNKCMDTDRAEKPLLSITRNKIKPDIDIDIDTKTIPEKVLDVVMKNNICNSNTKAVIKKRKQKTKYRLFIENINANIGDHQLKTKFEKFGAVSSAKIIRDINTNASKGFGFVTFKSSKASKRAIVSMHNTSWFGQKLRVLNIAGKTDVKRRVSESNNTSSVTNTENKKCAVIKRHSIKPTDPRLKHKHKQQQQQQIPKVDIIPPPPPPKPPITHNFSTNQSMECVPKHVREQHITSAPKTTSSNPRKANNVYVNPSAFYPNAHMNFHYQFRPYVIPANNQTQTIPHRLNPFNSLISQMNEPQSTINNVRINAKTLDVVHWSRGMLLGNLPDYGQNEYHKLRFEIEQRAAKPITALHILEKPIPSSWNPLDLFTFCAIFDSEIEMKTAFHKLKDCEIMNQRIICDMASTYMHKMNTTSITPSIESVNDNIESDAPLQSLCISPSISASTLSTQQTSTSIGSESSVCRSERDSQRNERYTESRRRSISRERDYYHCRDRRRPRHRTYNRDRNRDERVSKYSGLHRHQSRRYRLSYNNRSPSYSSSASRSRSRSYRR